MDYPKSIAIDMTKENIVNSLREGMNNSAVQQSKPYFHFSPMANWMNDPNGGIYTDGWYHMHYLQDPFDPKGVSEAVLEDGTRFEGEQKPNRVWAHTRTKDFINWQHLPCALVPARDSGELKPISGSIAERKDGRYVIAYTSSQISGGKNKQRFAVSQSLLADYILKDEILTAPDIGDGFDPEWRDPFLLHTGEEDYLLIGAADDNNSMILLYKAADDSLISWEYRGVLLSRPRKEVVFFECPKMFEIEGLYVLIFSPEHSEVKYMVGNLNVKNCQYKVLNEGFIDYGKFVYATENIDTPDGTVIMSWNPGWNPDCYNNQRNGNLSIPREISLDNNMRLIQKPSIMLNRLRISTLTINEVKVMNRPIMLAERLQPCLEFELNVKLDENSSVVLINMANNAVDSIFRLCLSEFEMGKIRIPLDKKPTIKVQCFVDKGLWEVFLDGGRYCYTHIMSKEQELLSLAVACDTGSCLIENGKIHKMDTCKYEVI